MEFLFPTVQLNGPVWPALFCPSEYAELCDWVKQSQSPLLGLGHVVETRWDPRFKRILEILADSPDVSSISFVSVVCAVCRVCVLVMCCSRVLFGRHQFLCFSG